MADNYLGRKMEEYRARAEAPVRRPAVTLTKLLLRNRSCRGYDPRFQVREDQLRTLIEVNTRIPSARNQQVLRFRPVLGDEARQLLPLIRLGGALPELHLPLPGTEPNAFIVICSTLPENRYVDMDLGISAQSMLLRAVEIGLNGICIGAFDPARVRELLGLPYDPLLILAVGKGAERIELTEIDADESHAYYRRDGVHYVPKVRLDDLLIERATKDE
uniref:nitroreductase family protein n=1 Tax=Alistipes megaguti TaxID=2364787 RepID=UPI000EFC6E9F|nr:nitroreductase family protein [Alistipes megaguti]